MARRILHHANKPIGRRSPYDPDGESHDDTTEKANPKGDAGNTRQRQIPRRNKASRGVRGKPKQKPGLTEGAKVHLTYNPNRIGKIIELGPEQSLVRFHKSIGDQ